MTEVSEDMILFGGSMETKYVAIGAILAAVYAVGSLIPVSGFIVASGVTATISITILVAPLFGILLGSSRGFVFGLIAGIIVWFIGGSGGLFQLVPILVFGAAISGLLTGLALKPMTKIGTLLIPGPTITAVYLFGIAALYLIPNYDSWWFISPYILAAFVSLFLQFKRIRFDPDKQGIMKYLQILPFAFIGTITEFSMMTMGAVYILAIPSIVFGTAIFPAMLIERTAATLVSTTILLAVIHAFRDLWYDNTSLDEVVTSE